MAGEWIKMRASLLANPKVIRIARTLLQDPNFLAWFAGDTRDVTHNAAALPCVTDANLKLLPVITRVTVGALLPLWSSVNECAGQDGVLHGTDMVEVDMICGVPGIGRALAKVGWIEVLPNEEGVQFSNFHEHNTVGKERSSGAKSNAERQKEFRERKRLEREKRDVTEVGAITLLSNHREEKKREERIPPTPQGVRFADFWQAWPNTDRRSRKVECEKKWKAKGLDPIADQILAHVEACKGTRKWQEGFEPAPLTYLNGRLWEDGDAAPEQRSFV
ncbi:MAG: hypothetical protein WKG52_00880 [Variovorax sp.]